MSKGIIKEKKPQTLSRWEVLKAWIAESIASIKRSLKDGGWKGTALEAAAVTSMVGAGIVLVACVPTEVQIEKVTSESEVNRLVSANFSEEDAVRDEMTKQFGALSDFEYNNGKATANVERNGKSYAVSAEIDLGASDFEVTKYTNAELSGNNLTYTSEGQDVSENVSDKIVVEENGVIIVIDPSGALNTISIAVSGANLTENVDPENPGGEDKPDPEEPENPGGEENPDPENPGDPTDPENPDPEEPENPTDPENPDPEEPENPTDPENPDPEEPENPTDPENPGGEDKPDPEEPENPDSQIETIDDINVIEQLLSQKDLTIEALAKAAATAFYGQDNVSNLSYQNGIVSGQAKTAEGTVNFSANLDLSATDFEGEFYAGAELSADGKTLSFYQNGTLTTLTITEDMAVIETADGVNILDTAVAEQMVANKFETTNNETSVPSQDITFDSWQELMSAGGEPLKESINSIFQDTLFTDTIIKRMFGNDMTMANLNDGTIEILKWAFHIDGENITSVEVMGNRIGYPREASRWLQTATFTFNTPINLSSIAVSGVENPNISNSVSNIQDGITYYFDLQEFSEKCANSTYTAGFRHTVNDETLDEANQAYFDLCMPLAVEAGLINADATLGFVSVQGSSSTNAEWGTTFNITIRCIDLTTNEYNLLQFVFDDEQDKDTLLERLQSALDRGNYRTGSLPEETIITGNQIFEFSEAMEGIVKYTIPDKNQE